MFSFKQWCQDNNAEYMLDEWDQASNDPVYPEHISFSSGKQFWWKCLKCGHKWYTSCNVRIKGHGCSICGHETARKKRIEALIQKQGSFEQQHPDLLIDWDYDNNTFSPSEITSHSSRKVHWKCHVCGTRWETTPANRTKNKTGCPGCSGRVVIKGKTDIFSVNSSLKTIWDFDRNTGINPSDYLKSSRELVYWKCLMCGASYQQTISAVASQGRKYCDKCKNRFQTSFPEQAILFYVQQVFSDALNRYTKLGFELDIFIPSKNVAIEYDGKTWHRSKAAIEKDIIKNLKCVEHGIHLIRIREEGLSEMDDNCEVISVKPNNDDSLQAVITTVLQKLNAVIDCNIPRDFMKIMESCKKVLHERSLRCLRPDLAEEFCENRNQISPLDVALNSNRKYWWNCPEGHEPYQASPNSRNGGHGCPVCGKNKQLESLHNNIIQKNGLLKDTRPDLMAEVDYENILSSIDFSRLQTRDDVKKIPWKCSKCGFLWIATTYSRTVNKTGCPSCSHSQAIRNRNELNMKQNKTSLLEKYPEIAREWHTKKNGDLTPRDISYGSEMRVWWICSKCRYEYKVSVNNRTSGNRSGCPICKEEKKTKAKYKAVRNIETGHVFESVKAANAFYGKKQTNISAVCRGERKTALGYHWEYV